MSAGVVLVTGGSRGIGRALVRELSASGRKVAFTYHTDEAAARALEESCGGLARAWRFDLADRARPGAMVPEIEAVLGPVDGLVNNAAIRRDQLLAATGDADWDAVIDANLGGAFRCCRAVLPQMIARRAGSIVNVSSLTAVRGVAGQAAYGATKAGLIGMTKSLARELGRRNIRVNAVVPGLVMTEMIADTPPDKLKALRAIEALPSGTSPEDVAAMIAFLLSDRAVAITGQSFLVDAGEHRMTDMRRALLPPELLPPELLPLIDDRFVQSCELFEEYVFRLTVDVFRRAGLAPVCAVPVTVAEAVAKAGFDESASPVALDWIFRELASRGVLTGSASGEEARYRLTGALPVLPAGEIRDEQEQHDPSALPSYALAALAAAHYPEVLRGETSGDKVLFGPDRIGIWSDYFSNGNVLYAISNAIGAYAADQALPPGGGAVLELGGGLGSGAEALLSRLRARGRAGEVASYRFTEVSIPFLRRGQRSLPASFPEIPFAFARLDMNRPFAEGDVDPGGYALVHGVNTLHVAADLGFTLREVRNALAPGGAVVISECVRPFPGQPVYVEFVFNLLEAFRAPVLNPVWRPNGGFLTPEQWTAALTANGFRDVRIVPDVTAIREFLPSFVVASVVAAAA